MMDWFVSEYLYSQCIVAFDTIVENGIDPATLFYHTAYGVFDAECLLEALFC